MKTKDRFKYAFAYPPKAFYKGTKKYMFYQFYNGATLILPQKTNKIITTTNEN